VEITPVLRQRLDRLRLVAPGALTGGGIGDRRSTQLGEGIEFEEHREYQHGDDIRRIDPFLFARLGSPYVREYNVGQQMTVTILLDLSRSMAAGSPAKLDVARGLANGLAHIALAGGDAVQCGVWCNGELAWHERRSGAARIEEFQDWWAGFRARGDSDLLVAVRRARPELRRRGLTVLISDLWSGHTEEALIALGAADQSVVLAQVLSIEEVRPEGHDDTLRLIDMETGEELDVALGAAQLERYESLLEEWTETLRQRTLSLHGSFFRVLTNERAEDVFLRTLPAAGILR
jgi:uncharacterized protein (DUF58 family)